ncbi:hypothetical protein K437DRAFT_39990 [Tilletiaria anomala UBC 951]|uniref:SH3 domain-containing protein n=1 Tax=Tilletiaria anomala (strain ATCC 24038 / CBS 436.72 / UBC 951) TaxID=1037660 RepID=A0A066WDR6_TILAU|nr:uncharacterized protein K437DRAFT_39990 [Tilletiaria anomala UBC 951]KDN52097.1 hypothetical protein K437DRAFT_39990 [Tilletiaria anomala UBC 951]
MTQALPLSQSEAEVEAAIKQHGADLSTDAPSSASFRTVDAPPSINGLHDSASTSSSVFKDATSSAGLSAALDSTASISQLLKGSLSIDEIPKRTGVTSNPCTKQALSPIAHRQSYGGLPSPSAVNTNSSAEAAMSEDAWHPLMAEPPSSAPPTAGSAEIAYPSPSGGFVPPPTDEEGQAWKLKPAPSGSSRRKSGEGWQALAAGDDLASCVDLSGDGSRDDNSDAGLMAVLPPSAPAERQSMPPPSRARRRDSEYDGPLSLSAPIASSSSDAGAGTGAATAAAARPSPSRDSFGPAMTGTAGVPKRPQSIPSSQETAQLIAGASQSTSSSSFTAPGSHLGSRCGSATNANVSIISAAGAGAVASSSSAPSSTPASRPGSERSDSSWRMQLRHSQLPDVPQEQYALVAKGVNGIDDGVGARANASPSPTGTRSAFAALDQDTLMRAAAKAKGRASGTATSLPIGSSPAFSDGLSSSGSSSLSPYPTGPHEGGAPAATLASNAQQPASSSTRPFPSSAHVGSGGLSAEDSLAPSRYSSRSSNSQSQTDQEAEAMDPVAAAKWREEVAALYAQLRVRDFAFPETDPRHVGARDVSAPQGGGTSALTGTSADGDGEDGNNKNNNNNHNEEEEDWGVDANDAEVDAEGDNGDGLALGVYEVLYAFEAESEHELTCKPGDRVRVVGNLEGGWAVVERVSPGAQEESEEEVKRGLVPESYIGWIGDEDVEETQGQVQE